MTVPPPQPGFVPAPYQAPVAIPLSAPAPGHPYPPLPPAAQVFINNTVSATAIVGAPRRRRQSFGVHVVLLLCTAGLGNLAYAWYISGWNRRHGL
ncbi:hypothetical protein [Dactylosporangium sp. CS-033363]|uniref:hypothetical protein n=1 Tax=Dactylosporangium sp. CS-033363 TaxID=3239935 RepID=UPI003D8B091C